MGEKPFWALIEFAWLVAGSKGDERKRLAEGSLPPEGARPLLASLRPVLAELRRQLDRLTAEDLQAFDRMLERKLYDIDRREVHDHVGGSDDGFLYARGFIVAAGKGYYDAVNANPAVAVYDLECERMCYLSYHLYEAKYGEMPPSGISRESCSNEGGWADRE